MEEIYQLQIFLHVHKKYAYHHEWENVVSNMKNGKRSHIPGCVWGCLFFCFHFLDYVHPEKKYENLQYAFFYTNQHALSRFCK